MEFMEGAPKKDGMETVGVIQFFQCHNFSNQVGCYIQMNLDVSCGNPPSWPTTLWFAGDFASIARRMP